MGQTIFDEPGDFVFPWPEGIDVATVRCWGAGGDGGRNTTNGRGGGGGGAWAIAQVYKSQAVASIHVGAGGDPGDFSSFSQNSVVQCKAVGGDASSSRAGADGGLASSCIGDTCASGGKGGDGYLGSPGCGGGGGGAGGDAGDGEDGDDGTSSTPGNGGSGEGEFSGYGGNGGEATEEGLEGDQAGGGGGGRGSGSGSNPASGPGGAGMVVIDWDG